MAPELSMRPTMQSRRSLTSAIEFDDPFSYQVYGLPAEQSALINRTGDCWHILHRLTPDDGAGWEGEYASAEEALAALSQKLSE